MSNLCTHGNDVYSYQTCIQTSDPELGDIFNATKYSVTTSKHQSKAFPFRVKAGLEIPGARVILTDVPRGATPADLVKLAREKVGA